MSLQKHPSDNIEKVDAWKKNKRRQVCCRLSCILSIYAPDMPSKLLSSCVTWQHFFTLLNKQDLFTLSCVGSSTSVKVEKAHHKRQKDWSHTLTLSQLPQSVFNYINGQYGLVESMEKVQKVSPRAGNKNIMETNSNIFCCPDGIGGTHKWKQ